MTRHNSLPYVFTAILIGGIALGGSSYAFQHKAKPKAKPPKVAPKPKTPVFADVEKVFAANCLRCHGAERPRGRINLTTYATVMEGGEDGPIVKAGDPAGSVLVKALLGKGARQMPPPPRMGRPGGPGGMSMSPVAPPKGAKPPVSTKLPDKDIQLVSAWIKGGAKEK